MKIARRLLSLILAALFLLTGCGTKEIPEDEMEIYRTAAHLEDGQSGQWTFGYGAAPIIPEALAPEELYIAGYNSGWYATGILDNRAVEVYQKYGLGDSSDPDYMEARALWVDAGAGGILLIGIDCVALSTDVVNEIRDRLFSLCMEVDCVAVNVYATHSHAGPDTLGLWGPTGVEGKNAEYMETLINAGISAAHLAVESRRTGELYFGHAEGSYLLFRDSRAPEVFDRNLYQLRFEDEEGHGMRLFFFGAHAESLRGDNTLLSRDFPGVLCDVVTLETGDGAMFVPGAIGGLIMTQILSQEPFDPVENLSVTGEKLAELALSIQEEDETVIEPDMSFGRTSFTVPLDNNLFMYLQFLGILNCQVIPGESATGYMVKSELSVLQLGEITIALIPGEIFPELVYGGEYGSANPDGVNPEPLCEIAARYDMDTLLVAGLSNDELGYIIPPSDYLVNPDNPYVERITDATGEDHYEETNSVGPECAAVIAAAFEAVLAAMTAE